RLSLSAISDPLSPPPGSPDPVGKLDRQPGLAHTTGTGYEPQPPGAVVLAPGRQLRELWYANFGMPHSLYNKGSAARVHLIIDCYISENLFDLFPEEVRQSVKQEEAIFFEEEQSLPEELSSLSGTIRLPSSFLDRYPDNPTQPDWRARGQANIEGELDVQDGRLVLRVAGRETAPAHAGFSSDVGAEATWWRPRASSRYYGVRCCLPRSMRCIPWRPCNVWTRTGGLHRSRSGRASVRAVCSRH